MNVRPWKEQAAPLRAQHVPDLPSRPRLFSSIRCMAVGRVSPTSRDAVVIIPGIMGSELVDRATRETLWGISDVGWYLRGWTSGSSLQALHLTDAERNGDYGRVEATRLLRFPAFAPVLQGFEPYTRLIERVRGAVVHNDAVAEFPYDWRLPISHNSLLLAEALRRH